MRRVVVGSGTERAARYRRGGSMEYTRKFTGCECRCRVQRIRRVMARIRRISDYNRSSA